MEHRKKTASELINALSKDWLERNGDTFVHIRKTGRLGWEKTLAKNAAYSSYLLEAPTIEDLFRRAYPLAQQTISAMETPFKVNIRLSNTASCTEGKNVYVATDYFDNETIPVSKKLDIFLGLTAHEGCHLLYTDFPQMGKAASVHPLCANLLNIIEDERIERILGEEKPGLANYLGAVKNHYFGRYAKGVEKMPEQSPLTKMVNCVMGLVRYPALLRKEDMVEYGEMLLAAKKILTPFPNSTAKAEEAAEKIYGLICEEYEKRGETSAVPKDEKGNDGKKNRSDSPMDKPKAAASESASAEKTSSSAGRESDEKTDRPESASSASESLGKDYSEIAKSLDSVVPAPAGEALDTKSMSEELKKDGGLLADICEGRLETGSSNDVLFHRMKGRESSYMSALSAVKQYIPAIRRVVKGVSKDYKLVHLGMRSGILDESKLAEAIQGVPTIYKRHGQVRSDRASVCVLVDESGSMVREGRMGAARKAAVLLNEAVSGIPNVDLFIYGHSADERKSGATELRIYREKNYAPRYALGELEARDNNRDGLAIMETAKRVRKQTEDPVLMFVLSDGAPAALGYIGREAINDTKQCVEKVEKMGFKVVQICINASYNPALMFKHYLKMENLSTLAHDLGKVISKTLTENIKSRVS